MSTISLPPFDSSFGKDWTKWMLVTNWILWCIQLLFESKLSFICDIKRYKRFETSFKIKNLNSSVKRFESRGKVEVRNRNWMCAHSHSQMQITCGAPQRHDRRGQEKRANERRGEERSRHSVHSMLYCWLCKPENVFRSVQIQASSEALLGWLMWSCNRSASHVMGA